MIEACAEQLDERWLLRDREPHDAHGVIRHVRPRVPGDSGKRRVDALHSG